MASSYETIQYGSTGDAVRQLQELLKKQGYDIVVDGSSAVRPKRPSGITRAKTL